MLALRERRLKVLPVVLEQRERERVRDRVDLPRLGDCLERAKADLVVHGEVVRAAIGVAGARVHVDVAGDRVGVGVVVLDRGERHVDAVLTGQIARPHAAAEDDLLGLDHMAIVEDDARRAAVLDAQPGDARVLADRRAAHLGALGERAGNARRLDLAVVGDVQATDEVITALEREEVDRFLLADHLDVDTEVLCHRTGAPVLEHALVVARHVERAALAPVDLLPRLGLETGVELGRRIAHAREGAAGAQTANHARGMPRRAAANLRLLEHDDVLLATLGEVIRDGRADHTPTDDDDARAARYSCSHGETCLDTF